MPWPAFVTVVFLNPTGDVEQTILEYFFRFNYTDHPPFVAYAVEGWWLDNLLKTGKLDRSTYLDLAAKVTVGFARRLADANAAERHEREAAVRRAVAEASGPLALRLLPMKTFSVVEVGIGMFSLLSFSV